MRGKTLLAAMGTLFLLSGFVFATIAALVIGSGQVEPLLGLGIGVGLTILWSLLTWLVSPWIMDLVQRWLYGARTMEMNELGQYRPRVAQFVAHVCQKHGIKTPRLLFIEDGTPQAYCYGSYANNARLVVTRGILNYLNDDEATAVYAHELGHIVHRDFIVMTIASTLLSVLWHVYVAAKNIRGRNNSRPFIAVALVAYAFWWVSQYVILYLSRTREYYADEFAAEETGNPNALSMALVKIAYGIAEQPATVATSKFLGATRAMGIADSKTSSGLGVAYQAVMVGERQRAGYGAPAPMEISVSVPALRQIEKVFLFDLFNPWATVSEFASTHPLTGKRIRALCEHANRRSQGSALFSFERTDAQGRELDMTRLYGGFFFELMIYMAPYICAALFASVSIIGLILGNQMLTVAAAASIVFGFGLGMTIRSAVQFPSLAGATPTTVIELMSDPYASPLKGRPVILEGRIVGRADAGNKLSEDVTLQDRSGGLITLNYESPFGFLGNWYFASRRVATLMDQGMQARGWFRRSISQVVDLADAKTESGQEVSSYTRFWASATGILVMLVGIALAVSAAVNL
jgi:Zn-dependent protease with chaperone function